MPRDVADRISGTVALCDHASNDRGKWNILGLGWSTCPADWTTIRAFVSVQWPAEWHGRHQFRAALQVWPAGVLEGDEDGSAEPLSDEVLDGVVEVPEPPENGVYPPVFYVREVFTLPVTLEPETGYLLRLVVNDSPVAWEVFATNPAEESDDEGPSTEHAD